MCGIYTFVSNPTRYDAAKNMSRELEKQATKVHIEADEAGDKALLIYANLTSLPKIDTKALEVCRSPHHQ